MSSELGASRGRRSPALPGRHPTAAYDRRVQALVARNAALEVIESAREEAQITKKELATETEMDASAVRKLLTADAPNPTVDSFFRLCAALNIRIQATTATGSTFNLV